MKYFPSFREWWTRRPPHSRAVRSDWRPRQRWSWNQNANCWNWPRCRSPTSQFWTGLSSGSIWRTNHQLSHSHPLLSPVRLFPGPGLQVSRSTGHHVLLLCPLTPFVPEIQVIKRYCIHFKIWKLSIDSSIWSVPGGDSPVWMGSRSVIPSRSARLYWASLGSSLGSVLTATIWRDRRYSHHTLHWV